MRKEVTSNRQSISIMILFLMGSTMILGIGSEARQDGWLAIITGTILAVPIMTLYARLLALFPGKNLYEIVNVTVGSFLGRAIALIYIWYAFHLGAVVFRNFQEFITVIAFPETPQFVPIMIMGILCIWAVKEGIEVLGRFSQLIIIILAFIIFVVVALGAKDFDFNNLRPFLYNGLGPVLNSAISIFSFPFAETVLFIAIFDIDKARNNSYKIFYYSLALGSFFISLTSIRNILVLGADIIEHVYFSSYTAVSLINIGDFLQRIEVTVSVVFLFTGFIKISVCLLAASKGVSHLFKIDNYRQIVAPIGLLMMATSCFIYRDIMEMQEFAFKYYKYYVIPFQLILPIIIWIVAEIKAKQKKKKKCD